MEVVFDFKNKTAKYTTTSPISQTTTATLTDAQIARAVAYKNICACVFRASKEVQASLYTVTVEIA